MQPLNGMRIGILGGDARATYLALELIANGAQVRTIAMPDPERVPTIRVCRTLDEVCGQANALIIPLPGIDARGILNDAHGAAIMELSGAILGQLGKETPIFTVVARAYMLKMAAELGLNLVELSSIDEFAIWNSIPSAEGAIQLAMEQLPITIHGSRSFVVGLGRTGATLARMLTGIGAKTTVVARRLETIARAGEMGFETAFFSDLPEIIGGADIIFNTVPAMVLPAELLSLANREVLIVDLASAPGGTDFEAARKLGIKAMLAPSLPGRVAPKTAGQIMARIIIRMLLEEAPGSSSSEQEVLANATQGR
ncbi:MAG: dipicolinate synthase subunit DpsA [Eubacteriales bacterium]|nr:dipicolinate synthase subunit DpsA [Bacillota bacterium]MBV1727408.1 dipicolinate synthase subunit DpsA [Desulforudis sp.]MDP3051557.1 dipicolinate synthase subunit DpsA [Eubacteriales bacterium]MDQ7789344.1 dipicolinate synthase subunit DpsA [Clostridia bacterium]MBU4532882.1 dipicolinate synthase subunit DpsA [Bacillota bacterium]